MACKLKKGETKMPEQTQTQDTQQSGAVGQAEQTQTQNTANNTQSTISNEELKKQLDIIDEKVSKHNSFVLNSFEASFDFSSEEEKDINLADGSTVPNAKKISRKVDEKIAQVDTKISQVDTKIEEFESYKLDKTLELDETKAKVETIEDILSTKANIGGNHEQAFKVSEAQLEYEATPLKQVNEKLAEIKGEIKGEIKTEIYTTLNTAQEGLSTKANVSGDETKVFKVADAEEEKDAVNLKVLTQKISEISISGGVGAEVLDTKANVSGDETKVFKVADAEEEKDAVNLKVLTQKISEISISGGGVGAEVLDTKANVSGDETKVFKVANAVEDKDAVNKAQLEEVKTLAEQKALISGSETQIFKVADAEEEKDAVNLKVLNQKLTEFRSGSSIAGGSANHSEIINSFDENKPVRFAESKEYDYYYPVITKRGDILFYYPNIISYTNMERIGLTYLIKTIKPYAPISQAKSYYDFLVVLYEDGDLYAVKLGNEYNFQFINSNVDNILYLGNFVNRKESSSSSNGVVEYLTLIYTKKDVNATYLYLPYQSSSAIKEGNYYAFHQDADFAMIEGYRREYILSSQYRIENFFYTKKEGTERTILFQVLNKKLYFKNSNRAFTLIPELRTKKIKEIKQDFKGTLYVLDEENNVYEIKRKNSNSTDLSIKTIQGNQEHHIVSIIPGSPYPLFLTNKKHLFFRQGLPNTLTEVQSDSVNCFINVEKEDIKWDYFVPYILKNEKKYVLCKGSDFLESPEHYGIFERDMEIEGAFILSSRFPEKDTVLSINFDKYGKTSRISYISKTGDLYAIGKYLRQSGNDSSSYYEWAYNWVKLN